MCALHKRSVSRHPRKKSSLPLIGAGVGALLVAAGVIWWGIGQPAAAGDKVRADDPAMRRLLEESRALEQEFARIRDNRTPTEADLRQLQRAIDNQREWMTATGSSDLEQDQRLKDLETMYEASFVRSTIARTQAEEAAGRELLGSGKAAEGVARLQVARDLQRQLNQRQGVGSGRDLGREAALTQEIERLEAEPLGAELAQLSAEGARLRDEKKTAEALAAYHRAHELQLRLNREFGRTQLASLGNLEKLEIEIATLDSVPLLEEVMTLSAQAADVQARGQSAEAVALFERAAAVQAKLNADFPRSRHASTERIDTLEIARQTELSAEAARRVAQLDREVAAKLRARDLDNVPELLLEGARLQDAMFTRLPRSRRLDPELRLKFNYLLIQREVLGPILNALADQFRTVPGHSVRMLRTEVPQRLFELMMRGNPSRQSGADLPVESVSAPDAAEFCRRLSWVLGRPVRLPNEGEYRAALGEVAGGIALTAQTWSQERSEQRIRAVASAAVNAAGFYDLLGNVAEWLAPDRADDEVALVAGGSCMEPEAELAKVPMEKRNRLERARTIGFRVVVE